MNTTVEQIQTKVPITILTLAGVLDATCYRAVIDNATQLFSAGTRALLLDLNELTFHIQFGTCCFA